MGSALDRLLPKWLFISSFGDDAIFLKSREEATGPIEPGKVKWGAFTGWPAVCYHPNLDKVRISVINVQYMNGEKVGPIVVKGLPGTQGMVKEKIY